MQLERFEKFAKFHSHWLILGSIIYPLCFFIFFHIYIYSRISMPWWPIGWDTADNIRYIDFFRSMGILPTLRFDQYVNFLYSFVTSFVPAPASAIEIYAPLALAGLLILAYFLLTRLSDVSKSETIVGTIAFASWYAPYRFMTDLHSELLGLGLSLAAVGFGISAMKRNNMRYFALCAGLFFVSSFAHIETTAYFVVIFCITCIVVKGFRSLKYLSLLIAAILPAGLLFLISEIHLSSLFYGTGQLSFNPTDSLGFWLQSTGYILLPASVVFLILLFLNQRKEKFRVTDNWYRVLIIVWFLLGLGAAVLQYLYNPLQAFSERAIVLLPAPLLVAALMIFLYQRFPRWRTVILTAAALILLSTSYVTQSAVISEGYTTQWISPSMMQDLQWLSSNFHSSAEPIFIMNENESYFSANSQLWDNWIQDIYGNHLTYLGTVNDLALFEPGRYVYIQSNQVSNYYFGTLKTAGISNTSSLALHPVILISDFYQGFSQTSYSNESEQIYPGIFLVNYAHIV